MKIIVLGLGSMGRRRLRLLSRFFPNVLVGAVDSRADRRAAIAKQFGCPVFESFDEALKQFLPSAVIICTSPDAHAAFLIDALRRGIHTFSELDLLDDGYNEIMPYEERQSPVAFLSSTPLFRSENRWIMENHKRVGGRCFYNYHVGQYLPDWHPWERYDEFFVGSPRTNAIREILCIELPWLTESFGDVVGFKCHWSKTSSLNLPYPDTCQILLSHSDGTTGTFIADCVSRSAIRSLRITGEKGTIIWEGNPQSLCILPISGEPFYPLAGEQELERQTGYADFVSETPYLEELRHFFSLIQDQAPDSVYCYARHHKILRLVDDLEKEWRDE